MTFLQFDAVVTATTMSTPVVNTNGRFPGVACYINNADAPGVWVQLASDTTIDMYCIAVQTGSGYIGQSVFPDSFVNSAWTVRTMIFWLP